MATTVQATTREPSPAAAPAPLRPWYRDRTRQLLAAIIVAIVVALVGWFVVASGERKEQFAARSLNQARAAAEAGNLPLASSELQRLITTYRGTDAASEAVIALNQIRLINGQNELAAVGLRQFLAGEPPEQFVAPAYGLLAAALENARRWDEAGEAYTQASNVAEVDYLKSEYLVDAGRAYAEGGKLEEAERAYRTVLEKYADSPSFTEAQVRLAELTDGRM
ncbi:MAG: tetratricopeptide repeat protein [Gemmatimonadales bacterium]